MDISYASSLSKTDALALRYGEDSIPAAGAWNDAIALLLSHRSIRGYRPDALPAGTLETLIAAAQSAATSSNLQTWSVTAAEPLGLSTVYIGAMRNNAKEVAEILGLPQGAMGFPLK